MIPELAVVAAALAAPPETLLVRTVPALLAADLADALGEPAARFGDGRVRVWLVRSGDTVALYAAVRDSTVSLADELVVSLDMEGDGAPAPQHDDFQWRLRRTLDSSVVHRGRGGRWEPPRSDPEWRLGAEREGGGWRVEAAEGEREWRLVLRLHAAMLAGGAGRLAALAIRAYDGTPGGWYAWPPQRPGAHPTEVERAPSGWCPVRLDESS